MKKQYTADFETTTDIDDCRVWAWSVCDIHDFSNKEYGNDISSFIQYLYEIANCDIYFHNLRFDSQFIIWYLIEAGFKYYPSDELKPLGFTTIINGTNQIYQLKICFDSYKNGKKRRLKQVTIFDSLKKLPFPVKKIAKDFKLPVQKLELEYTKHRDKKHEITNEEKEYLSNDVEIMARALAIQFEQGLTKMTIGSDALNSYKKLMGKSEFQNNFPILDNDLDTELRKAYHGGWTYVNPKFQDMYIGEGKVYDVNSLYPWALRYNTYPVGMPYYASGKYEYDEFHPLHIQKFSCEFKLKEGYLPCVQIKKSLIYNDTEYLTESKEMTTLYMCDVDLKLFFDHYDVYNVNWLCYWAFMSKDGLFNDYIDGWYKVKETSSGAVKQIAKLMLNNLYGKFATSPHILEKKPVMIDNEIKYVTSDDYYKEAVYIPVGVWCTAYARNKTIRTAQSIYDRFMYADTDSLHVIGNDEPIELYGEVDDKKLGKWKNESNFLRARYLKAKTYIEEEEITEEQFKASESKLDYMRDGKFCHLTVKCAGMNDAIKEKVTWDNFRIGFTSGGKLVPKNVKGGVVLVDTDFTIKKVKSSTI